MLPFAEAARRLVELGLEARRQLARLEPDLVGVAVLDEAAESHVPLSPEKGLRDAAKAKAANAEECAVRAVNRVAEAQRAFLMAVRVYSRRVDAIERAETSTPPKPAWKVIKMCDKADGDMLAAQQNVDSLTHLMQEALLRVSEAENRVAYWEKRKLERRIRAALRRKHCGAH